MENLCPTDPSKLYVGVPMFLEYTVKGKVCSYAVCYNGKGLKRETFVGKLLQYEANLLITGSSFCRSTT